MRRQAAGTAMAASSHACTKSNMRHQHNNQIKVKKPMPPASARAKTKAVQPRETSGVTRAGLAEGPDAQAERLIDYSSQRGEARNEQPEQLLGDRP
jgi:hypothetical protein